MLKNSKTERFFCTDKNGVDLFFIELMHDTEINYIHFACSLRYPIYDDGNASDMISKIVDTEIPDSRRQALICKLIKHLQTLPNIERGYFQEYLLNKSGKYLEYYDKVTSALLRDKDFEDYTFFTPEINGFYFDFAKPILEEELKDNRVVFLNKNTFENLVKNKESLAWEYVNLCSENTQFFQSIVSKKTDYECCAMADNLVVILFFIYRSA